MGPEHRVAAVAAWLGVGPQLGATPVQLAVGAVFAGAVGHGRLSPDADQEGLLAKVIPGGHRGITHWPPVTVALFVAASHVGVYAWQLQAVAVAWASHLAGDLVFGDLPLLPRLRHGWIRIGLGLDTGGRAERRIARPLLLAAAIVLALVDTGVLYGFDWLHPRLPL